MVLIVPAGSAKIRALINSPPPTPFVLSLSKDAVH